MGAEDGGRWTARAARRRHREFWEAAHSEGWEGRSSPSPLARWSEPRLPEDARGRRLLELGFGAGHDLPVFLARGFTIAGIELSRTAAAQSRASSLRIPRPDGVPRPILDAGDALEFLATQPDGSASVVYANLFHSMGVPVRTELARWREVYRVLAPGGLHVYSVRTTADAWYGIGRKLTPSTFDPGDEGPPLRFFRATELLRRIRGRFTPVARSEGTEGEGRYVRTMLYAVDRKLPSPPMKAGNGMG
jgi:SAM-dependent methyltransferase